jgi:hypothetical protein
MPVTERRGQRGVPPSRPPDKSIAPKRAGSPAVAQHPAVVDRAVPMASHVISAFRSAPVGAPQKFPDGVGHGSGSVY